MKCYPLPGVRPVIFRPGMPLQSWLAKQEKKPFALVNASLYNGDGSPVGTIIEGGIEKADAGNGFGFGVCADGTWAVGGPWDGHAWDEYLSAYPGLVQRGQFVAPAFADRYVFDCKLPRIGLGEKGGVLQICVADGVDVSTFGRQGYIDGLEALCNLDGGGSRFLYYDGKTVCTSGRTPYNAIAFYREEDPVGTKFTVCVDPGHGGTDNTNGAAGYREHEFSLALGVRLRDRLLACGVGVVMTREMDRTVSLNDRAAIANGAGADYFVSLHSNAEGSGTARGLCVYTATSCSAKAVALAQRIVDGAAADGVATFGSRLYRAGFVVLTRTRMPAVLVECGFHTNAGDRALLSTDAYRARLAGLLAKAICAQLGVTYKEPAPVQPPAQAAAAEKPAGYDDWLACMEWYASQK